MNNKLLAGICAITLTSCAAHKVPTPSTVGVQSSVSNAKRSNQEAQRYNDINANDAQKIEAKTIVLQKYWK